MNSKIAQAQKQCGRISTVIDGVPLSSILGEQIVKLLAVLMGA